MTAVPKNPRVSELRELFRNLNAFRAVYEETGLEDISTPDGGCWSIWDLEYLHDQLHRLTQRQRQAITLCLIHNMRERDAAVAMQVAITNPVMMYATLGIQRLLDMVDAGELTRYRERELDRWGLARLHNSSFDGLVSLIRSQVRAVGHDCWIYPNPGPGRPTVVLRSPRASSGFIRLYPAVVLFEALVGPVPKGSELEHTTRIPAFSASCVNPHHAELIHSLPHKQRMESLAAAYAQAKKRRHEQLLDQYLASRRELVS